MTRGTKLPTIQLGLLGTSFPNFKIATYNACSLSWEQGSSDRHQRILTNISILLETNHILLIQETKLVPFEEQALKKEFPHHLVYYNNSPNHKSAGQLILVLRGLSRLYHISENFPHFDAATRSPDPTSTDLSPAFGHIQGLLLEPKDNNPIKRKVNLVNVYLSKGAQQIEEIILLNQLDSENLTILAGDFNFTEHRTDSPTDESKLLTTGLAKAQWDKVTTHLRTREVSQPVHTHYCSGVNARTSRIDRVYISMSAAELALISPRTFVAPVRFCPIAAHRALSNPAARKKNLGSDHVAVALSFSSTKPSKDREVNVPRWLASEPSVIEHVRSHWTGLKNDESGYQAIDRLKLCIREAVARYFSECKDKATLYREKAQILTAAISLLRLCSIITPNTTAIRNFLKRHPCFVHLVDLSVGVDFSLLSAKIDDLLTRDDAGGWFDESDQALPVVGSSDLPPPEKDSVPSNISLLDEIKLGLPSDRVRLTGIRRTLRENPTEDPDEMGDIIVEFWDEIWKKRRRAPTAAALVAHLRGFTKRMRASLAPAIPTVDALVTLINGSNNSSPGPDGIPFSFFRMVADLVAVCLLDIIKRLSVGEKPPVGFNHARLYLIPKNNSFLVINTRPISVTNVENRLIAKMINDLIMPSAADFLHPAQKGFVPGRQGVDNIVDFNQAYYSSLSAKQQRYVLLLDTKKAFDSLDHDFIRAVLSLIGLPSWTVQLIDGLLDHVRVSLVLSCKTDHHINIERGVKQGCPLSPLIFILCYDVLLESLAADVSDARFGGFADDLAVESVRLSVITHVIGIIKEFARFSGLGLNMGKTVILTTLPTGHREELQLKFAGYGIGSARGRIRFVDRAVYLGVLMGREVKTEDIFEKAHAKFTSRISLFRELLRRSSIHKRTIIFNVFLVTIYSYLAQLYEIPRHMVDFVREAARTNVVNFHGGGFGYAHLVNPRAGFGPFTPVRDVMGSNIAALAFNQDLLSSHGLPTPNPEVYAAVFDPLVVLNSMLIKDHRLFAAFRILHDCNNRAPDGSISSKHLSGSGAKVRGLIYRDFIDLYFWRHRESHLKSFNSSLTNKLNRLVPGQDGAALGVHIRAHAKIAAKHMTPALWNNQFKLILNALPTDTRRVRGNMVVQARHSPLTDSIYPCYICGSFADDIRHMFQDECIPTRWARESIRGTLGLDFDGGLLTSLLAVPPGTVELTTTAIISLNFAIWKERAYLKGFAAPPDPNFVAKRIFEQSLALIPRPRGKTTSKAILDFLSHSHEETVIIFTDGSAIPNPGPCGAGVYTLLPLCLGGGKVDASVELGVGSNNIGEMHAILTAVTLISPLLELHQNCKVAIFTDSNLCEGHFMRGWAFTEDPELARQTRQILQPLLDSKRATLSWVKAHDDLEGNDRADHNAKRGAKGSARHCEEAPAASFSLFLNFTNVTDTVFIEGMDQVARANYIVKELTRSTSFCN